MATSSLAPPTGLQQAHLALVHARELHAQGNLRQAAEAYRRSLFAIPANPPANPAALLGLSLIARQTAQPLPALHMAQAALAANPRSALTWSAFGDALLALGHHAPAQSAFTRALALDPGLYAAYFGLGNTLAHQDNYPEALTHFTRAAELAPHSPECHFARGFSLGKLGRHTDAIQAYRRAITLRPGFASAWLNLGVELVADGRDQLAAPCYGQAIQAARQAFRSLPDPASTELSAHLNLGHLARGHRRFLQAQACYQRAVDLAKLHPHRRAEVHLAFAYLHLEQHRFPQAWISLREAERADPVQVNPVPANPEIPNARGILLLAEHAATTPSPYLPLIEEALLAFEQAEALGHKTAGSNRGNALLRLGRVPEALAAHHSSLARDPHHPGVRYNLALTQLRSGNFTEGWPNYEIRWQFREVHPHPRIFPQPRWRGETISRLISPENSKKIAENSGFTSPESLTLFLYAEQGLGDTLQFFRYLPLVAERLPNVPILLEVQPPLQRLLAANLGSLPIRLIASGDPIPPFTHHCPLMSLPAVFATTIETVPNTTPYIYLAADMGAPSFARPLREGWVSTNAPAPAPSGPTPSPRLTIGLNWAGNPRYRADRERSTILETFLPLFELPGIRWISLQKGPAAVQLQQLPPHLRPIDAGSPDLDLADTAATIAQLDLVLTTDTAIAHLAGALGKPLWLLLPWQSDWRWMQETSTTPWYPTARLWRQSSPNDWPGLINRIADRIAAALSPASVVGHS
jgi:tetratricopeptide (TPR) repeat protein